MDAIPCKCGEQMVEVVGFEGFDVDKAKPFRSGWYCPSCKNWEKAILRERLIDTNEYKKHKK
jgi:hypothetical protein